MEEEANSDESEDEGAAGGVNVGAGGQGGFGWGNFAAGMQYQQQHSEFHDNLRSTGLSVVE